MPIAINAATQVFAALQKSQVNNKGAGGGVSAFAQVLGQHFDHISKEGRQIEANIQQAVLGRGGLEHVAQDFAEFSAQVEAIKNIADAGISSLKQIINTPL